jgi:hypothetical protein
MGPKQRKLSEARHEKLRRLHERDCPARQSIEFGPCMKCVELEMEPGDGTIEPETSVKQG